MRVLPQIVSCSGGRTSGYLTWLKLQEKKATGADIRFVFMDTGAEHPKTYEFLRNIVKNWGVALVCLRFDLNPEMGKRNLPKVVSVDDIGPDLQPWRDVLYKYGPPGIGRAWCTSRMKQEVCEYWATETFGKGGWVTWLGIRADEPKRLTSRSGISYLADISDFEKEDVLRWWGAQTFDLGIPEWLGNCVFCFKKSVTKVAMAAKDEPKLAEEFCRLLEEPSVRDTPTRNGTVLDLRGYRGRQSLRDIITMFRDVDRDDLERRLKSSKRFDTGSCSESCEIYNDDVADGEDPASGLV
jgi:hypothetical protein